MTSTADIEHAIVVSCGTIVQHWHEDDVPATRGGSRPVLGPRVLIPASWLTRASIRQDLAYWVHAALGDYLAEPPDGVSIDLGDPVACARHLSAHARELSGWRWAGDLVADLRRDAEALRQLTTAPEPGTWLGDCPREILDRDGHTTVCGGHIRAEASTDTITCPRCRHTDSVVMWHRIIVGALEPMTDTALARYLRRLGVRTTALGIRHRVARGSLPGAVGQTAGGRDLYDAAAAVAVLIAREVRHAG